MYKFGDKFKLENVNLEFEVMGVFPGGQQRMISIRENTYRVLVNGQPMDIVESHLKVLLEAEKNKPNEEVNENVRPESGPGSGRVKFGRGK